MQRHSGILRALQTHWHVSRANDSVIACHCKGKYMLFSSYIIRFIGRQRFRIIQRDYTSGQNLLKHVSSGNPILRHFSSSGGSHRVARVQISGKASQLVFLRPNTWFSLILFVRNRKRVAFWFMSFARTRTRCQNAQRYGAKLNFLLYGFNMDGISFSTNRQHLVS